jgi:hypothetical protein
MNASQGILRRDGIDKMRTNIIINDLGKVVKLSRLGGLIQTTLKAASIGAIIETAIGGPRNTGLTLIGGILDTHIPTHL